MNEKEYTLITSIGTGTGKAGYKNIVYHFPKYKTYKTSLFLEAIIKTKYRPIKKVILIGTTSSSWDALIPNPDSDEDMKFWDRIVNKCRENAFSDESKKEFESKLSEWYENIKFEISIHTNELIEENVNAVFDKYMEIPDLLEPETNILFDITHGFRSMPLLIFQSLQLNSSKIEDREVELIYAELIYTEDKAIAHNLSEYWNYYEINSAKKQFDEKWNGKILAEKIRQEGWESGAKFLERFSEIVECNFSLQLPINKWESNASGGEALKQLKNALDDYNETGKPKWVTEVRDNLNDIYKFLKPKDNENYPVANAVWKYSQLLREKKLITQAVIALQVVVETAIAEKYDPSKIGDYDWFHGYFDANISKRIEGIGEKKLKEIRKKNNKMSSSLGQLERRRHQIAHGGGKDKNGNYPHQANIPGILKQADYAINELFTALDKENIGNA